MVRVVAVVKREPKVDPKQPNQTTFYALLSLRTEEGKVYSPAFKPFTEYKKVADMLNAEAGVSYEHLEAGKSQYDNGEEV